jgi:cytochrome P450
LAATSFLGIELGPQANALNRAFVDMVAAIVGVVRTPIPGTQMWKGVKGREAIVAFFRQEIPRRRAGQATDLFSELCRATKDDGSLLSDQEIADHMSFLMMAAHDTVTSSVTSLVYLLGKNQEWQDKLRAEMHGLGLPPGAPLPYDRLGELALLEMAFKEAMRINPPVPGVPRAALRDFQFKGHDIPAGAYYHQHHLHAPHARNLAGAAQIRSAALYGGGCPRPSQVCLGALWRRRAYVSRPAFRLCAGEEFLLSPADDDKSEPCS